MPELVNAYSPAHVQVLGDPVEASRRPTEGLVDGLLRRDPPSPPHVLEAKVHAARDLLAFVSRSSGASPALAPDAVDQAYREHSTAELLRSAAVLRLCQVKPLVRHANELIGLGERIFGPTVTHGVIGATFYRQFAAGYDVPDVRASAQAMIARGVYPVLDYAAEADVEDAGEAGDLAEQERVERQCDSHLYRTLESVRTAAAAMSRASWPMIAIKITSLANPVLLERFSKVLESSFSGVHTNSAMPHTRGYLDADDVTRLNRAVARLDEVMVLAGQLGVRVYIDAEQSYFQPAIDHLALEMMRRHNAGGVPVCATTYQCYRRDALPRMLADMDTARREGFAFAAKTVRGAYMHLERSLAAQTGREDPIHATIEATHECYNLAVATGMNEMAAGNNVHVMVATHNRDSVAHATAMMDALRLPPSGGPVHFAQLLGMADYLTYPLARSGYQARKFTPYGPVKQVIPYLIRRAQENSDALGAVRHDLAALRRELSRRALGQRAGRASASAAA